MVSSLVQALRLQCGEIKESHSQVSLIHLYFCGCLFCGLFVCIDQWMTAWWDHRSDVSFCCWKCFAKSVTCDWQVVDDTTVLKHWWSWPDLMLKTLPEKHSMNFFILFCNIVVTMVVLAGHNMSEWSCKESKSCFCAPGQHSCGALCGFLCGLWKHSFATGVKEAQNPKTSSSLALILNIDVKRVPLELQGSGFSCICRFMRTTCYNC